MRRGDAFFLEDPQVDKHLWIVLSDPQAYPDEVVLVNVTTWRDDKDQSCVIEAGTEHPCVPDRSCVYYQKARLARHEDLEYLRLTQHLDMKAACPDALLQRIIQGARTTRELPAGVRAAMERQGLFP